MIEFQNVSYRIGGRVVLDDVSFSVAEAETLVLLGRSGSGKTTALKMVNRLLTPTEGRVVVNGRATTEQDPIRLRRRIGYVIQDVGLFPHFTVERNIGLVPALEGWQHERIRARVEELLQMVGLEPAVFRQRFPRQLSGGQRQRVGVARALAADPDILLFDEPFGALDPVTRSELQRYFVEIQRRLGKTAIFVTHDIREALRIGDRVGLLKTGRLEALAAPADWVKLEGDEVRAFLDSAG